MARIDYPRNQEKLSVTVCADHCYDRQTVEAFADALIKVIAACRVNGMFSVNITALHPAQQKFAQNGGDFSWGECRDGKLSGAYCAPSNRFFLKFALRYGTPEVSTITVDGRGITVSELKYLLINSSRSQVTSPLPSQGEQVPGTSTQATSEEPIPPEIIRRVHVSLYNAYKGQTFPKSAALTLIKDWTRPESLNVWTIFNQMVSRGFLIPSESQLWKVSVPISLTTDYHVARLFLETTIADLEKWITKNSLQLGSVRERLVPILPGWQTFCALEDQWEEERIAGIKKAKEKRRQAALMSSFSNLDGLQKEECRLLRETNDLLNQIQQMKEVLRNMKKP